MRAVFGGDLLRTEEVHALNSTQKQDFTTVTGIGLPVELVGLQPVDVSKIGEGFISDIHPADTQVGAHPQVPQPIELYGVDGVIGQSRLRGYNFSAGESPDSGAAVRYRYPSRNPRWCPLSCSETELRRNRGLAGMLPEQPRRKNAGVPAVRQRFLHRSRHPRIP